jgi:hypothetical protein
MVCHGGPHHIACADTRGFNRRLAMLERSRAWNAEDLARLIADQVHESVGLDYKAAGALGQANNQKLEVGKDVSAFANSAGGVLVYGMTENGHVPAAIDPVTAAPLSKEWLENVIISNVQPRIDGLHVNPIQIAAGRYVYVVTVPQSHAAHQASDHRYYKRFNFQSVPMEDYEVRDTMNRGRTPLISVAIKCRLVDQAGIRGDVHRYEVHAGLENNGGVAAKTIKIVLSFPSAIRPDFGGTLHRGPEVIGTGTGGAEYKELKLVLEHSGLTIFPSDSTSIGALGGYLTFEVNRERFDYIQRILPVIGWTVYADDMSPRTGKVALHDLIQY